MENNNELTILKQKFLGLLGLSAKAGKVVCGTDATIEDIGKHKVKLLIIAEDASEKTKKNMKYICEKNNLKVIEFGTIDEISRIIGKSNRAIVGIKSESLSDGIKKLIKEYGGELLHGKTENT